MGAARVVWWAAARTWGRRRGRGAAAKGRTRGGAAAKQKREEGGLARVWGGKSVLPSVGSRSTAQTCSHVYAPDPSVQVKKSSSVSLRYAS
jgi:hypothetical protein